MTTIETRHDGAQAAYAVMLAGPDKLGIPAKVGRWLTAHDCTPAERGRLFSDSEGTLFLRWEFATPVPTHQLRGEFADFADMNDLQWTFTPLARPRLLVLASKEDHVLVYLLSQHAAGLLPADILGVASNHEDTRSVVESYSVPFTHIPWPAMRNDDPLASPAPTTGSPRSPSEFGRMESFWPGSCRPSPHGSASSGMAS